MPGFVVSFNGYIFSDNGRAHFSRQARYETDAPGASAKRAVVTYAVQEWFLEDTFAANQAKYQEMLGVLRNSPAGQLQIADENGTPLVDVTARPQADNLPDQWGQHMTECTVEFTATELIPDSTVDATVNSVAVLKNVTGWRENMRTDRPTYALNDRRETIGGVTATGRILADPTQNENDRRTYLQGQRDAIRGIALNKEVTLVFGTFNKVVRIDSVDADIKDGSYELEWTVSASYRAFPTGTFTEAEYDVSTRDDRERSERITTVRGKIRSDAIATARTKLASITSTYLVGNRTLRRSESTEQLIDGPDDTSPPSNYGEVTFTLEYREPLDLLNWTLTLVTRQDARSGTMITTFSGRVTALIASNALAQARTLGLNQYPVMLTSSESLTSSQIDDEQEQFIECVFSYEYQQQGTLVFAEVRSETNDQTFSESTTVVSGVAVAATQADALALARGFKPDGLQLNSRETVNTTNEVNGSTMTTLFIRVEFQYTFHAVPASGAIEYAEQISKDYETRLKTTTYSGSAIAETDGEADALIDSVVPADGPHKLRDDRTYNWAVAQGDTIFRTATFSVSVVEQLEAGDDDILEAEMTLSTTFSVDHAVFTNIPFGDPYVQANCGNTPGVKQVSGSVRALTLASAQSWARGKRTLAISGGYEDPPEERQTSEFVPFSGTDVKAYRFGFTYSARFPVLVFPG